MKLYATTTSERATKGQGGNKYILTQLTIDRDIKNIIVLSAQVLSDGGVDLLLSQKTDSGGVELWRGVYLEKKGKRQKGDI
jgi:hypothetical protein